MPKNKTTLAMAAALALLTAACSSIDCPLNNRTYATFRLAGDVAKLEHTLTVSTPRSALGPDEDTVLINRLASADSIALPMSYTHDEDTLYFTLNATANDAGEETAAITDTVWIKKQNVPHFESVDCSPAMFHNISEVRSTHHAIDDIQINNNKVTYNDAKAHFLIYFKSGS